MEIRKAFNILEMDQRPILLLGALHFVVAAAYTLFDIGITSLLVANLGAEVLPQVYVGSALLLIFASLFIIPVIDRLDRFKLFAATLILFAAVLALSHHQGEQAPGLIYRALYVLSYLMKSLLFLQFSLIAGEVCDLRQAKRLFPILLGFSLAGGVTASAAASMLPRWMPTEDLLLTAAVLLVAALIPTRSVAQQYGAHLERPQIPGRFKVKDSLYRLRSDLRISLSSPLLRSISTSFLLFAFLAQVLDFLMGKAASVRFTEMGGVDVEALTSFYALLNGSVIGVGALVQLLAANRLISSLGVTRGQLAAPLAVLTGFASIGVVLIATSDALGPEFFFAVLASRAVQKVLRISIHRTSTDLVFNPIPADRRGRAKAFKETIIEPAGVLIGGLFLLANGLFELRTLVIAALVVSGAFLLVSLRLHSAYLASLVGILEEKSRLRFAFPSSDTPQAMVQTRRTRDMSDLERALNDDVVSVRLLGVEVAAELRDPAAAPLLVDGVRREQDPRVRATMVAALGRLLRKNDESMRLLEPALEDRDPRVRANGIEALAQIGLAHPDSLLPSFETDPEARIRANAAVACSRFDPERGADYGREILEEMYRTEEEAHQRSALYGLGEIGDARSIRLLDEALVDESLAVRRQAILSLAQAGRREAIGRLVRFMEEGNGTTRRLAARALAGSGEAAVEPLLLSLWGSEVDVRRHAIEALDGIGSTRADQALLQILSLEAEQSYYDLVRLQRLRTLPQTPGLRLVCDALVDRVKGAKENTLDVLDSVFGERDGMRLILGNLIHPELNVRSNAVEALEVRVDADVLGGIQPLFEHANLTTVAEHGGTLYDLPTKQPIEVLFELARDPSGWTRACALYALGELGSQEAVQHLAQRTNDPYELARLNAIHGLGRLASKSSLSILERIDKGKDTTARQYAKDAIKSIKSRIIIASD